MKVCQDYTNLQKTKSQINYYSSSLRFHWENFTSNRMMRVELDYDYKEICVQIVKE